MCMNVGKHRPLPVWVALLNLKSGHGASCSGAWALGTTLASRPSQEDPKLVAGLHAVALERKAWSQPVDAGAISDRGKQQARPRPAPVCLRPPASPVARGATPAAPATGQQRMCVGMSVFVGQALNHS